MCGDAAADVVVAEALDEADGDAAAEDEDEEAEAEAPPTPAGECSAGGADDCRARASSVISNSSSAAHTPTPPLAPTDSSGAPPSDVDVV